MPRKKEISTRKLFDTRVKWTWSLTGKSSTVSTTTEEGAGAVSRGLNTDSVPVCTETTQAGEVQSCVGVRTTKVEMDLYFFSSPSVVGERHEDLRPVNSRSIPPGPSSTLSLPSISFYRKEGLSYQDAGGVGELSGSPREDFQTQSGKRFGSVSFDPSYELWVDYLQRCITI